MIAGVRGSHLWRLAGGVAQTAVIAARRIMAIYETEFEVRHKHDKTPVTDADLAAHEIISRGLAALEPGVPILSEEGEIPPFERRSRWKDYWLVDPLDGTRGFAARSGEFTINVALVSNGRPVLGIVAVPVTGSCYAAVQDGGARLRHADGAWQRIRARRLPAGQVTVLRSRRRRHADVDRLLVKLGGVRVMVASSSLKACLVARGLADLYPAFGPTGEWDTAASQCLVEQAGGGLTDLQLRPLRYNTSASLENPCFVAFGDPRVDWRRLLAELNS
jgi:3'(2'), 5'-bisphosphate nucleotidase